MKTNEVKRIMEKAMDELGALIDKTTHENSLLANELTIINRYFSSQKKREFEEIMAKIEKNNQIIDDANFELSRISGLKFYVAED